MNSGRRRARQLALQALFEDNQTGHGAHLALEVRAGEQPKPSHSTLAFARVLVQGVVDNKERIDAIIVGAAPAWPIDQMAVTDRIALEIGVFEVGLGGETPVEVAINEAVELAKLYGGENSAAFVNGTLRTVAEQAVSPSRS